MGGRFYWGQEGREQSMQSLSLMEPSTLCTEFAAVYTTISHAEQEVNCTDDMGKLPQLLFCSAFRVTCYKSAILKDAQ
jgi:hypothetical protein